MNNNDKKLYKDYFYNVKPSPKLVAKTKKLMKAEEQKKFHKQRNVPVNPALVRNFRQYGSFVVSLVFALSVTLNVTEINPSLPTAPFETTTEETSTTTSTAETTELTSTTTLEKTESPITTLDTVVTERQTDSIATTISETENPESTVITNEIIVITDDNTNTTTLDTSDTSQEENLITPTSKTTSATSTVTTTITSVTVPTTTTVKETTITKPETISVPTVPEITTITTTPKFTTTTPRFTTTTPQITTTTPKFTTTTPRLTSTEETITITQPTTTTITSVTDDNATTTTTYEPTPTTSSENTAETTIYNSDLQSYVINPATDIQYVEYDNYGNMKTYTYEELKEIFGGNFLPDEFLTDNIPYDSAITFADKEVWGDDDSGLIYFYGNYDETFSSPFLAVRINLATRFNFLNTFMFDHKAYYYSESYGFIRQLQIYKISDNIFSDDLSTYVAEFNILRDEKQIDFQVTASQVSISQFIATLEKFFERLEYR